MTLATAKKLAATTFCTEVLAICVGTQHTRPLRLSLRFSQSLTYAHTHAHGPLLKGLAAISLTTVSCATARAAGLALHRRRWRRSAVLLVKILEAGGPEILQPGVPAVKVIRVRRRGSPPLPLTGVELLPFFSAVDALVVVSVVVRGVSVRKRFVTPSPSCDLFRQLRRAGVHDVRTVLPKSEGSRRCTSYFQYTRRFAPRATPRLSLLTPSHLLLKRVG